MLVLAKVSKNVYCDLRFTSALLLKYFNYLGCDVSVNYCCNKGYFLRIIAFFLTDSGHITK